MFHGWHDVLRASRAAGAPRAKVILDHVFRIWSRSQVNKSSGGDICCNEFLFVLDVDTLEKIRFCCLMFGLSVTTVIWKTFLRFGNAFRFIVFKSLETIIFVENWRPSPLVSVLINWFEVVAVEQMQEYNVFSREIIGFVLGTQCLDCREWIRMGLERCWV
eukprot:2394403-Lingulodinium_polyedra.AAC.1